MQSAKLSVIVPLAPAEQAPKRLLSQLAGQRNIEVIVSAADSKAGDLPEGVSRLTGDAGRGRQLNRGARAASAAWLWFVHADSTIEAGTLVAVERFITRQRSVIGYCNLRFYSDGPAAVVLNAIGANLRSSLLGLPYGDQGLCLPATCFERLQGFREDLPRGEDLDFIVRARIAGLRTKRIGTTIHTSARRYRERGWLRTTLERQRSAWHLLRNARGDQRTERP